MDIMEIVLGLVVLTIGAELLVRGASRLACGFGISSLVIGLTVVAFGTSAPELAVSVSSALNGQADVALGNVVGSNIFNVLFILGLSALIVPLVVDQKLIRFDVPVMIGVSALVWAFSLDREISRLEGGILFCGLLGYTAWCVVVGRRESVAVQREYDEAFGAAVASETASNALQKPINQLAWQVTLILGGLVLLVLGADWFVEGAISLARRFGISDLVIGLTIVAGGTSLPELATSMVAAVRGERDIAVGNVVGSNVFNILGVLGVSAMAAPHGVPVAEQAIQFDTPVMTAVAVACLPVFFTGHLIARWEGILFLGYYAAYTLALILLSTKSEALPLFESLMFGLVIPLTTVTLIIVAGRSIDRWRWQASRELFKASGDSLPRVVVIGGGFGGLSTVRHLNCAETRITLIDRRNFHLFQPLLYQVATGSLSPANIAAPLRDLLGRQWNAEILMADVEEIDLSQREVHLANDQHLRYDYLVVATGVRHSYFGHPEWAALAPGLKSIEDATEIRRRILTAFECAEHEVVESRRRELLTFVIVGGGPTGVELAGALAEIARHTLEFEFRSINPSDASVIIVEAADRLLAMYPPELSDAAKRSLERLGVEIRCRSKVSHMTDGCIIVVTDDGEAQLRSSTILWAAGIEASPLARSLANQTGAELDRAGRVHVQPDLRLPGLSNTFVIGDMADCRGADGKPLPGIAPVAMQQGKYVARQIRLLMKQHAGRPSEADRKVARASVPFHYRHQGSLATIGRSAAVAHIGWWKSSGFTAWLLWLLIHISKLSQFQSRVLVLIQWTWSFVTFGRSARLITGSTFEHNRSRRSEPREPGESTR